MTAGSWAELAAATAAAAVRYLLTLPMGWGVALLPKDQEVPSLAAEVMNWPEWKVGGCSRRPPPGNLLEQASDNASQHQAGRRGAGWVEKATIQATSWWELPSRR